MNMNKRIKITLRSDLCSGSGEGNGSYIDSDVCFNLEGFPYIPAKRIKGVLKEAAIELVEFCGKYNLEDVNQLFGEEGKVNSQFVICDGRVKFSEEMIKEIHNCNDMYKPYVKAQHISDYYTNVRMNTTIDDKSGTAKDGSLRSTRVVHAKNEFYCNVKLENDANVSLLEDCCKMVRHMGLKRTRGLGEVRLELMNTNIKEEFKTQTTALKDDVEYKVVYQAFSDSALMMTNGKSMNSQPYIAGSSILGYFARQYLKSHQVDEHFKTLFLSSEVIYSNVYISDKEANYYQPVLACIKKVKDTNEYLNAMYPIEGNRISSFLHAGYVNLKEDKMAMLQPLTMMNYHHQRPKDKSIGHAIEEDGVFYQLNSLKEGQYFLGSITSKGKYLKELLPYLQENNCIQVGKSKTAQYGQMRILKVMEPIETRQEKISTMNFAVVLTSPLLLFDEEHVRYSNDVRTLIKKIKTTLDIPKKYTPEVYLNFTTVAGYNTKWNLPKPQYPAFDGGSVLVFKLNESIVVPTALRIGEHLQEGLGQLEIRNIKEGDAVLKSVDLSSSQPVIDFDRAKSLVAKLIYQSLCFEASEVAMEESDKDKNKYNTTFIGRLTLMLKNKSLKDFEKNVAEIKTEDKKQQANKIIKLAKEQVETLPSMSVLKSLRAITLQELEALQVLLIQEYLYNIKLSKRGEK